MIEAVHAASAPAAMVVNVSATSAAVQSQSPVATQTSVAPRDVTSTARTTPDEARQRTQVASAKEPIQPADAGISFEYKEGHRVMSVHDSKGVLIYQMPPKGQLQLIIEQEKQAALVETSA